MCLRCPSHHGSGGIFVPYFGSVLNAAAAFRGPPKAQPRPPACPAPWDIWGNWENGAEPRLVMEATGPLRFHNVPRDSPAAFKCPCQQRLAAPSKGCPCGCGRGELRHSPAVTSLRTRWGILYGCHLWPAGISGSLFIALTEFGLSSAWSVGPSLPVDGGPPHWESAGAARSALQLAFRGQSQDKKLLSSGCERQTPAWPVGACAAANYSRCHGGAAITS
ncbi:uncharacterized protein LOC115347370 [Aquila chrysaetos chrysaetos]|uniref:uncharacterized protein LOC115347370 n=1 Tax=Aquila chrysaetos chrysaetos TaxID=223781 RepID=UPI0011770754|nr:uncharacterized protein LOC115347370 [Aquila chrysaetos chrysaetos]